MSCQVLPQIPDPFQGAELGAVRWLSREEIMTLKWKAVAPSRYHQSCELSIRGLILRPVLDGFLRLGTLSHLSNSTGFDVLSQWERSAEQDILVY